MAPHAPSTLQTPQKAVHAWVASPTEEGHGGVRSGDRSMVPQQSKHLILHRNDANPLRHPAS
jgi:hypothetical protein